MSFPKLSDFMGKSSQHVEYKRLSVIHALNNSLTRNTILQSNKPNQKTVIVKPMNRFSHSERKQPLNNLNYEQKLSSSLLFTTDDLHKLLQHLFKKQNYDINDRNFIRRLLLKHFPQSLIYSAHKDFINSLQYTKIQKNQVIYPSQYSQAENERYQQKFYLLLKGKVKIFNDFNTQVKTSGEYFGQLQIMGGTFIKEIHAKTDSMLLMLDKKDFQRYFLKYFEEKYTALFKRVSLTEPLLNLVPYYNKLKIMNLVQERQFKTGQKMLQKGEPVSQITFINNCEMSFSQDKILNEYKVVGLNEIISMQNPISKDNVYCMENTYLFVIKVESFLTFLPKQTLQRFLFSNLALQTINNSQLPKQKQTICSDNSSKLQSFIRVKKVKFLGHKSRFLTQPSSRSISNTTPKAISKNQKYPQYVASFVFLKKQASKIEKSIKKRHEEIRRTQNFKFKELKGYLMKTRESFRKKRWLDEMQLSNQNSIIYNPQKTIQRTKDTLE